MPVLLSAGKGKRGVFWTAVMEENDGAEETGGEQGATSKAGRFAGAVCPVTITAKEVGVSEKKKG